MDSYRNLTRDYWETKAVYAQVYPNVDKITFTPASLKENRLITDLRPTIWRKLDRSEVSVIGKKEASQAPDLNQYFQSVKSWEVQESLSEIVILATVNYAVNTLSRLMES